MGTRWAIQDAELNESGQKWQYWVENDAKHVARGGHQVPEEKVRARFQRLWRYVGDAVKLSDRA